MVYFWTFNPLRTVLFVGLLAFPHIVAPEGNRNTGSRLQDEYTEGSPHFVYQQPSYPRDCKEVLHQCSSTGTYFIKPDGYVEPFEVYCDHAVDSGGWTVISRRDSSMFVFNRKWREYKAGFGFLSTNFWLGNEKLSYLTNQDVYELRIEILLSNRSSFYLKYAPFRISDEWSEFALLEAGKYKGNASDVITNCPMNMVYGNCSCQSSCEDPNNAVTCNINCDQPETCICADGFLKKESECVSANECGCYIADTNSVVPNNGTYIDSDCTTLCTCTNNILVCNSNYECSPNALCRVKDGARQCYCNEGFDGDGETCNALYTDCYDAYEAGSRGNGAYTIFPSGWQGTPFNVSCDMTNAGGGWTIFQRRTDGISNFTRNWESYKYGFGSIEEGKYFWLGNEQIFQLTNQKGYKLQIDVIGSDGTPYYAEYTSFRIDDVGTNYRIVDIGTHTGNTDNGMDDMSGAAFSTYDQDNDRCDNHNCAERHGSGWWHNPGIYGLCSYCYSDVTCRNFQYSPNCHSICTTFNLNGVYSGDNGKNINWYYRDYCNPTFLEMKIRPSIGM